ncbi:2-succinyl-5-enolpyruvyl-6-hydroxy-3-cyclohexene-1-carboxylic-acid synthase [Bacillus sp. FJAT-42376]|uniref:2-succinyl-5-enolpyruvyl-6-hydroxy-3- cyclohexene-1-carboxylic-acid synthase n=1 Tax=Bacillus sp. FJAT-42376 TaxID=2014076 RepID=UPI000F50042E|nr:2-succinyl-5-enolpyruvyl-6-hydroxy-3-cyclohexene-1-carboxylic-acid synthase [Bacillus sp. FJAT-42376]AZB44104.1 2-succinyl-5-enolpyruvyl-6-hydroxy-3-cyclohexene-1-carboxylic-acid synthase [Bacillus sp. FJAT-42376]
MTERDSLTKYAAGFIDELAAQGITDAVISPGSRSTPFAILFSEHPEVKTHLQIDERSAAFYALGMAKRLQRPIVLLCTSGTAAANYFPAVVEAHYANVPLIVLTADRPHELRDVGAPQAINQNDMYGKYVKWFVDAAVPEDHPFMHRYARTLAGRAYGQSAAKPMGPVHLNFPFREPLVPNLELPFLWRDEATREKHVVKGQADMKIKTGEISRLQQLVNGTKKGVIVCGEIQDPEYKEAAAALAAAAGFPILADPLSNIRSGSHSKELVIEHYDSILKDENLRERLKPELVIRLGAMPVSKPLFLMLRDSPEIYQIVADQNGNWRDPTLSAAELFSVNEADFCRQLAGGLQAGENEEYTSKWKTANNKFRQYISHAEEGSDLFEGRTFLELMNLMPDDSQLFVGNSMPIRDADTYLGITDQNITVYANRGANGIDGVVSSSLGVAAASKTPTVLVIGDLSLYHDLNGLLGAKLNDISMTIILLNNDGGGIFSFLPQSSEEKHFESLFGTPIGLDYRKAADLYNASYSKVASWEQFRETFKQSVGGSGIRLIEVPTNRHTRVKIHRDLLQFVSQEIMKEMKND